MFALYEYVYIKNIDIRMFKLIGIHVHLFGDTRCSAFLNFPMSEVTIEANLDCSLIGTLSVHYLYYKTNNMLIYYNHIFH